MTAHGEEVRTQILHAIISWQNNEKYNPTIQDIVALTGIPKSTVFKHLDVLRRRGVVALDRRFSGWRITETETETAEPSPVH